MEIIFSSAESIWNKKELWQIAKCIEYSVIVTQFALLHALCVFNFSISKYHADNQIGLVFNKAEK